MKSIRYLFYMILILSNIDSYRGSHSISVFIEYLQESGYYDLIQEIKNSFGDDVTIAICEDLFKSKDCEILVKVYMQGWPIAPIETPNIDIEKYQKIIDYLKKKYNLKKEMLNLINLFLSYYSILKELMKNDKEIINFIERILKSCFN